VKTGGRRHGPAAFLHYIDVYGVMVYDWMPSQAAMTAVIPWSVSGTTLRNMPPRVIQV
jgi:hypothetical protein